MSTDQVERDLSAILDGLKAILQALETHNMAISELAFQLDKLNKHMLDRLKRMEAAKTGKQPS